MDIYATSILQAIVVLAAGLTVRWLWRLAMALRRPGGAAEPPPAAKGAPGSDLSVPFVALALVVVASSRADMLHAALAWVFVASQLGCFLLLAWGRRPLWCNMALAPGVLALAGMVVLLGASIF